MATLNVANRTLFIGDNLPVLRGIDSESIDLIATDPPFNKGVRDFEGITKAGENVSYSDVWSWSDVQVEWTNEILGNYPALYSVIQAANASAGDDMGAFLCWLAVRVLECHWIPAFAGMTVGVHAAGMTDKGRLSCSLASILFLTARKQYDSRDYINCGGAGSAVHTGICDDDSIR